MNVTLAKQTRIFLLVGAALVGAGGLMAATGANDAVVTEEAVVVTARSISAVQLERPPVPVIRVAPTYPLTLRQEGRPGTATVRMLIDTTGRVAEVRLQGATRPEFGERALEAARQWTFEPARAEGKATAVWINQPFVFAMPQVLAMAD